MINMINIETTNKCTAHCTICPRELFNQKLGVMDNDLFKKIIDDAFNNNIKYIDTCGFGDPLTDNFYFDRCEYIKNKSKDFIIYMSSTLNLLKDSQISKIINTIDILKISFYGIDKETYFNMHKLDFNDSFDNMKKLIKAKKEVKKSNPYIIGLLVETDINKHQTSTWISYFTDIMDEVFVWKPHNWAGLRTYRDIDYNNQRTCGRPINGPLYVHVDGKVSPCCWDINKKLIIGDMNTQTIQDIYNSEEYLFIKNKHEKNDFNSLLCYNCEQTNVSTNSLIYKSNKNRNVGQLTPNMENLI